MNNLFLKVARLEAQYNYEKSVSLEGLRHAYEGEVQLGNKETAAEYARKIRNKLLEETDNRMALDRLNLPIDGSDTPESWLPFLKGLADVLGGDWAKYRQELRDLPTQEGWPLDIEWPVSPIEETFMEKEEER